MTEKDPDQHLVTAHFPNEAFKRYNMIFLNDNTRHQLEKVIINKQLCIRYTFDLGGLECFSDLFSVEDFMRIFEISKRTVQRWLETGAPTHALRHLALLTGAVLPSAKFRGFYLRDNGLYTPSGHRFDAGQLETIAWHHQELNLLRREVRRLETESERVIHQLTIAVDHWRKQAGAPMAANDED